jgi:hypothetical protein
MYSGTLPTLPDDHIFKKIYGFNFDSSGLPETDLLRFALVGLEIFDLYCESGFTFCRPALAWQILPGYVVAFIEKYRFSRNAQAYIRSKCSVIVS